MRPQTIQTAIVDCDGDNCSDSDNDDEDDDDDNDGMTMTMITTMMTTTVWQWRYDDDNDDDDDDNDRMTVMMMMMTMLMTITMTMTMMVMLWRSIQEEKDSAEQLAEELENQVGGVSVGAAASAGDHDGIMPRWHPYGHMSSADLPAVPSPAVHPRSNISPKYLVVSWALFFFMLSLLSQKQTNL